MYHSKLQQKAWVRLDITRDKSLRIRYAPSSIKSASTPVCRGLHQQIEFVTPTTKVEWTLKEVTEPLIGSEHWSVGMLGIRDVQP